MLDVSAVIAHNAAKQTITRSELVYSGKGQRCQVSVPVSSLRSFGAISNAEVQEYYIQGNRVSFEKSEARKKQLLALINEKREELRNIPMSTKHVGNKIVKAWPVPAKEAIKTLENVDKFINKAFNV